MYGMKNPVVLSKHDLALNRETSLENIPSVWTNETMTKTVDVNTTYKLKQPLNPLKPEG